MDSLFYVLICPIIALITLIVTGLIQREFKKHLVFLCISCVAYFISYAALLVQISPVFARVVHPVLLALAGLLILRGVLVYLNKALHNIWVFAYGLAIAWVFFASSAPGIGMTLLVLGPRLIIGLTYLMISVLAASRAVSNLYKGSWMIGIVFILWGTLNILIPLPWMTPGGYLIDGLLGLTAAISFLLLAMNSSQELLIEEERKFRALFTNANDAIFLSATGDDGTSERLLEVNEEAERLLGFARDELLAMDRHDLQALGLNVRQSILENGGEARLTFETEYATKDGGRVPVEVSANTFRLHGQAVNMSIVRDISERKRAEAQIQYLALYDALTGLSNRVFFDRELKRSSVDGDLPLSLIVADLNGLKLVNDLFGHDRGDALLVAFGGVLRKACPPGAVASRWGGDEFVLLMPRTDERAAQLVAARIGLLCEEMPPKPMGLSVALGVATASGLESITSLLKTAEDRMYRHKFLEQKSSRGFATRFMRQALEEKSHETEGHCERLQRMGARVGRLLGLNGSEIDELSLAAMLHDIGKLAIPDQILAKPGELTEDEYQLVKGHSEIGFKIACASPELSSIAKHILSHHERWDGRGYPDGLAGEGISLYSRIIAVVDAYDAMVFRKKMPVREAVEELTREAGRQFDPLVVKAFLAVFEDCEDQKR